MARGARCQTCGHPCSRHSNGGMCAGEPPDGSECYCIHFADSPDCVGFAGHGGVDTAPHEFAPLKRWFNRGRCRACLAHEDIHPALGWLPARPLYDTSEAYKYGR
jgi:hypothetical protein